MEQDKDAAQPFPAPAAESAVPVTWQEGDVILDQYEVRGILGEGGMGRVYSVYHRGWNIDLAVKTPKPAIFAREGGKENFIREAETWIKLGLHPHIVSCFYVRLLGNIPHVFAEYVAGGSLADWVRSRRLYAGGHKAALERILDIAVQFAWGLHYSHEQGLVHQDVKPANVMMTSEGVAKVTDFGLAKARALAGESEGDAGSGQQSILVSSRGRTPAYCSPEQVGGHGLSRKTDIWSWGVSILELFVGEVTWMAGPLAREALASHQAQDAMIPPMPSDLVKLLVRCFQPQPEDRPASMLEVAAELQAIYTRLLKSPYSRQTPKPAEILADSLNNQALSLYDLGKVEEAKQKWEQALAIDPQHLETTYNRGVVLWRRGELADDALVQQLQVILAAQPRDWLGRYLLAQVHIEQGEADTTRTLLEEGMQLAPQEAEMQILFERVRSDNLPTRHCLRTLRGHTREVYAVSLSADDRSVFSFSLDGTLRLWEASTGRCLSTLKTQGLTTVSEDGYYALSVQWPGTLQIWEVSTGRCLHTFPSQHMHEVTSVSLSADGRYALSGSQDRTLRLWEVSTGRCLHIFQGHKSGVTAGILSRNGRFALSASQDGTLRLWEVTTGRCLRTFQGHTDAVNAISLNTDGSYAFSGSSDGTLRLWEANTGRCLRTFQGHIHSVGSVSLSGDGCFAIAASRDKTVRLWEMSTGRCLCTFRETDGTCAGGLSADGHLLILPGSDHSLQLWELPHQEAFCRLYLCKVQASAELSQRESQAEIWFEQARQAEKEKRFALALELLRRIQSLPGWERTPKSLEAWSSLGLYCSRVGLRNGWEAKTLHTTYPVVAASLSRDSRYALSTNGRILHLWEVTTGRCLRTFQHDATMSQVRAVSLSMDGKYALSGDYQPLVGGNLRLWEVSAGRCLRTFQGHTQEIEAVSLSYDSRFALSGSRDKTLRLWEVSTGRCLRVFQGHTLGITSVSLSADNRFALSASWDATLRLWEMSTGRCLRILEIPHPSVPKEISPLIHMDVNLSADGRHALSASWTAQYNSSAKNFLQQLSFSQMDETLHLWEVSTGRCLRTFQPHTIDMRSAGSTADGRSVGTVSLSADSRFALSASRDGALRLWEVSTGRCLRTFQGHTGPVRLVSLSADSRFAFSVSTDKTLRLWELDWELEAHEAMDWDEAARPFLDIFLSQHTPYVGTLPADRKLSNKEIQWALTHSDKASWTEEDFQGLIRQLQYAGLGWLRPEKVQRKLQEIVQAWQGPPAPREESDRRKGWFGR